MPDDATNEALIQRVQSAEAIIGNLVSRLNALETQDEGGDSEGYLIRDRNEVVFDIVPVAAASGNGVSRASSGITIGTFDLTVTDIELMPDVLEVDLVNDKIIVKEGNSGIYLVSIDCEAILVFTGALGENSARATTKQDGTDIFDWKFASKNEPHSGSSDKDLTSWNSQHQFVFVDASAGDVDLTADYRLAIANAGSVTLNFYQFSAMLVDRTDDATP